MDDIVLKAGTALGKTANTLALGTLQLDGDDVHTLELGADATMEFADSSAKAWSGTLLVKGFRNRAVRFGTSKSAITGAQLQKIRADKGNGRTSALCITADGYLVRPGMIISLR